jgi:hypothetical protein
MLLVVAPVGALGCERDLGQNLVSLVETRRKQFGDAAAVDKLFVVETESRGRASPEMRLYNSPLFGKELI